MPKYQCFSVPDSAVWIGYRNSAFMKYNDTYDSFNEIIEKCRSNYSDNDKQSFPKYQKKGRGQPIAPHWRRYVRACCASCKDSGKECESLMIEFIPVKLPEECQHEVIYLLGYSSYLDGQEMVALLTYVAASLYRFQKTDGSGTQSIALVSNHACPAVRKPAFQIHGDGEPDLISDNFGTSTTSETHSDSSKLHLGSATHLTTPGTGSAKSLLACTSLPPSKLVTTNETPTSRSSKDPLDLAKEGQKHDLDLTFKKEEQKYLPPNPSNPSTTPSKSEPISSHFKSEPTSSHFKPESTSFNYKPEPTSSPYKPDSLVEEYGRITTSIPKRSQHESLRHPPSR